MEHILYKLYKEKNGSLSKKDIDNCSDLPSYNTLCRRGYRLSDINNKFKEKLYLEKPKHCKCCQLEISYSSDISTRKFCSKSCSIKVNNTKRIKKTKDCSFCNTPLKSNKLKFCSSTCSNEYKKNNNIQRWLSGEHIGCTGKSLLLSNIVKNYLWQERGTQCSICSWDEKHPVDGRTLTEFDHIDGNPKNNTPSNLRILCPNCHSKTSTYRARNKNSTRIR